MKDNSHLMRTALASICLLTLAHAGDLQTVIAELDQARRSLPNMSGKEHVQYTFVSDNADQSERENEVNSGTMGRGGDHTWSFINGEYLYLKSAKAFKAGLGTYTRLTALKPFGDKWIEFDVIPENPNYAGYAWLHNGYARPYSAIMPWAHEAIDPVSKYIAKLQNVTVTQEPNQVRLLGSKDGFNTTMIFLPSKHWALSEMLTEKVWHGTTSNRGGFKINSWKSDKGFTYPTSATLFYGTYHGPTLFRGNTTDVSWSDVKIGSEAKAIKMPEPGKGVMVSDNYDHVYTIGKDGKLELFMIKGSKRQPKPQSILASRDTFILVCTVVLIGSSIWLYVRKRREANANHASM